MSFFIKLMGRAKREDNGQSRAESKDERQRDCATTKHKDEPRCLAPQFTCLIQVAKYVSVGRRMHVCPAQEERSMQLK